MRGEDVTSEQIRTLYRQTTTVLLANCAIAAVLGALLWSSTSRALVAGWLGAMAAVTAVRMLLARRYRSASPSASDARAWGMRFVLGSIASGSLWGATGFLFVTDARPLPQLLVVFFVGGMCAAAAGTLAAYLPAFVGFILPALAALALRAALFGDALHQLTSAMLVFYGAGLFAAAKVNQRALAEAFVLRFENAELVTSLSRTQRTLEQTNRALEHQVTERSEALRKQAQALRDAQRLEAIGRLAGGVAHDFNNLLTIILANISELAEHDGLDARTRAALREMRDAGSKGAGIVRQLLTFSRRQRTTPETLDVNRRLARMDRLLTRLLGERVTLRLGLHATPLFVHMDPTQMEQVIINLITNARDAMPDGGLVSLDTETVELRRPLRALEPGLYVRLRVADTGTGMDAETRRRIFEPFFTTKSPGKGTGLGLPTAYGIVEEAGGAIDVTSEPGAGSQFDVYLPLAEPPPRQQASAARLLSGFRHAQRSTSRAAVLLVEDEPTVRSVTRRILESAGHRVVTSASAERALEIADERAEPIDLLVTDVVMPGIDGASLAERLRADRPSLKVLLISGYGRDHVVPRGLPGSVGFLAKPFTRDALLATVAELLAEPTAALRVATRDE